MWLWLKSARLTRLTVQSPRLCSLPPPLFPQADIIHCNYPGCYDPDCAGNRIVDEYDARIGTHTMRVILPHHKNSRRSVRC